MAIRGLLYIYPDHMKVWVEAEERSQRGAVQHQTKKVVHVGAHAPLD